MKTRRQAQNIASNLRNKYREGTISEQKIAFLKECGFVFDVSMVASKENLLEMAKNGKPKPSYKTKLGIYLLRFLCEKGKDYDAEFEKDLKETNSSWLKSKTDCVKEQLLEMAKKGESRPNTRSKSRSKLFNSFYCFISPNSEIYDSKFEDELRQVNPLWFVKSSDKNKEELLKMARDGKLKPPYKLGIAKALKSYLYKQSSCYDPVFDAEIRRLAPHWFKKAK